MGVAKAKRTWMTMIELALRATRLYCTYPTDDVRERTQHDSSCKSQSDDDSKNMKTVTGTPEKIEARPNITLEESRNERGCIHDEPSKSAFILNSDEKKWADREDAHKDDVVARLILLYCKKR